MQNITSTVSHEMRTPLGTIQQFVMLLMTLGPSAVDRKQAKHFLHLIKYQVSMLLGYVNDLLDLKQINQGVFEQNVTVFDPNKEVFDMVIEMLGPQAKMK